MPALRPLYTLNSSAGVLLYREYALMSPVLVIPPFYRVPTGYYDINGKI